MRSHENPENGQGGDESRHDDAVARERREREGNPRGHLHAWEYLLREGEAHKASDQPGNVQGNAEGDGTAQREADRPVAEPGPEHCGQTLPDRAPELSVHQHEVQPGEEPECPKAAAQTHQNARTLHSHHPHEVERGGLDRRLAHGFEGEHHGDPAGAKDGSPDRQEGDSIRQVRVAEDRGGEPESERHTDQSEPAVQNLEPESAAETRVDVAHPLGPTEPQDARETRREVQHEQTPRDEVEAREREADSFRQRERGEPDDRSLQRAR